jgi:diaminopimelate epimerase
VRFSKWHALGNDYLLVERADGRGSLGADAARRLCDVHTGIGADGVLEVVTVEGPVAEIVIWNPDGSEAELSGNGTRIAARWLAQRAHTDRVEIVVHGRRIAGRMCGALVETAIGPVEVGSAEALQVGKESVEVIPVTVGNPHAVIAREPDRSELLRLGPLVEGHPRFPNRTNVQLVAIEGRHDVRAAVWERGAGETRASGTSACAVAGAAVANGWCDSPISVHMPGGTLAVTLDSELNALLVGPAQEICRGELSDELRAELDLG